MGTEGQRRERVPSAWGELSPTAHRGQGPATHPGTPGTAVTAQVMKAGDGRAEMLGTAGSSSVGTAPPQPVGPGDQHWVPVGLPSPALAVPWLLPATSPLAAPNPRCVSHLPTSALGGLGSRVSTGGTPQRMVQSSSCTFGAGGWGGSRRCLRVVSPPCCWSPPAPATRGHNGPGTAPAPAPA